MAERREFPRIEAKTWRWIASIVFFVVSFFGVALVAGLFRINSQILISIALAALGLLSLRIIDRDFVKKIFLIPTKKDLLYIVGGFFFTMVSLIFITQLISRFDIKADANPIFDMLDKDNIWIFFISSCIQFILEEIIFIVPFLFVYNKMKSENETLKVVVSLIVSSAIFGAMHLSTYNFNIIQAVVIISLVRIALSMTYIVSKNLTVTYVVHILYDWAIIMLYIWAINTQMTI